MDDYDDAFGLCLCQQDAYLRSLATTVISCAPYEPPSPLPASQPAGAVSGGKGRSSVKDNTNPDKAAAAKGPSSSSASPSSGAPPYGTTTNVAGAALDPERVLCRYEVYLGETPMFPESGGQPCDQGQLVVSRPDGTTSVVNVTAVMWKQGALCHVTDAPLEPGTQLEVTVDWQRRYDLMQQHTGQHVFSAVADLELGADTASWELHPLDPETHGSGDYGCVAVDLTLPNITAEQLNELEARANAELRALRPVRPVVLDPRVAADVAQVEALRGDPTFRGSLPPPDKVKGGKLRLIHVEGLDINACGGTHVRSTGEVQVLKVVGAERTRGHTRVRLMAGGRALAALAGCLSREAALTAKLTCPPARHAEVVDMMLRDRRDGAKARKLLAAELATHLGRVLALEADGAPAAPPPPSSSSCSTTSSSSVPAVVTASPASTSAASSSATTPSHAAAPGASGAPGTAAGTADGGGGGGSGGGGVAAANGTASPASCPLTCGPATAGPGRRWAMLHRPSSDLDFLSQVAGAALEAAPWLRLLLLTADGTDPGSIPPAHKPGVEDSTDVTFLVAGQPELVRAVGPRVAEALGGRGGGRPGRYQGKAVGLYRLPAAKQAFLEAVSASGLF